MQASPFVAASVKVAVALILLLAVPGAQAASATRTLPHKPYLCNESYLVAVAVDLDNDTHSWFLDESLPSGWSGSLATQGGSTATPGHVKWAKLSADALEDTTVYYFLYIPRGTHGNFSLSGEFRAGAETVPVGGDATLAVTCSETSPTAASHSSGGLSWRVWVSAAALLAAIAVIVVGVLRSSQAKRK